MYNQSHCMTYVQSVCKQRTSIHKKLNYLPHMPLGNNIHTLTLTHIHKGTQRIMVTVNHKIHACI